jgi:ERCC4-type nuclease
MSKSKYTVIVDTREKTPWSFAASDESNGSIVRQVKHGDYSLDGLEDLIFIERKASTSEVAQNVIQPRFKKLLEKSRSYKYKFIICEFSLPNLLSFPHSSNLPPKIKKSIMIKGPFIMGQLINYQLEYGVQIVFCDNPINAKRYVESLLKKIYIAETNV